MNRIKYILFFTFCFANYLMFGQNVMVDQSFNFSGNFWVNDIDVQSNGKIIIGGQFFICNGLTKNRIFRMEQDGSTDQTFDIGSGFNGGVNKIAIQQNNKIIVGGNFTSYNGTAANKLIRLNEDGTIDPTLNIGTGFNGDVTDVFVETDGKIIVGGSFTSLNGITASRIVRLNEDGSVDNSFYCNSITYGGVSSINVQNDGRILVGAGPFLGKIARLNQDGTIDNSFNVGTGYNGAVLSICFQPDGKVLTGTAATEFNGTPIGRIARLNPDGSLDNSFVQGTGFNEMIRSIKYLPSGQILVGGDFSSYNSTSTPRLARINSNGSIDLNFNIGSGFDSYVNDIYGLPNGQILAGGIFNNFNGSSAPVTCRLTVCDNIVNETLTVSTCAPYISPTGQSYVQSGTYNETILSSLGCDSISLTIDLTILNSAPTLFSETICGGSYNWNGINYNQSGQYSQTLVNQSGCDSVVTMDLTVTYITNVFSEQVCYGSSYTWNGQDYSSTGQYSQTLITAAGCDSIVTLDLFVSEFATVAIPQICLVGLDSLSNLNRVIWEKPLTTGIDSFYVYKETTVSGVYELIGGTDYNDPGLFLDVNSNTAIQAYRYKISARDTCGLETSPSDFHKTIHLTINQGSGNTWNLIWSHYEGISFGSYNIYRGTNPSNITLLTTIQSNLNSFTDLNPPAGPVYYQIEVVNPNNCDPNKVLGFEASKSNIVSNQNSGTDTFLKDELFILPNPTTGEIMIKGDEQLIGATCFVKDDKGRTVLSVTLASASQNIDISSFKSGLYFLFIANNSNVRKIIKL